MLWLTRINLIGPSVNDTTKDGDAGIIGASLQAAGGDWVLVEIAYFATWAVCVIVHGVIIRRRQPHLADAW